MKSDYYSDQLNSQKLYRVYQTDIPRITQYLKAEINYVKSDLAKTKNVLELGAGYGRIVKALAPYCASITGIDISENSVVMAREYLKGIGNATIKKMDIHKLVFSNTYDVVLCLQNGLSAMRATADTIENIIKLATSGGRLYFSSYSENFWDDRLQWFIEQSQKGLLGEIDMSKTKDGVIICKDGFKAKTHSVEDFYAIGKASGYPFKVEEVDESSLFLVIDKI